MLDSRTGDPANAFRRPVSATVTSRCRLRAGSAAAIGATRSATSAEPSPAKSGTAMSAGRRATRPYAVRLWWEMPRCRSRASAPEIRSEPTGRPPRIEAALTASPALTPEKPQRVPVPRFPGPWVTMARSACRASLAASRPECTVTASRSPPNACPTVTVAASSPASRSVATEREKASGSAPWSLIT